MAIDYITIVFPEGRILRVRNLAGAAWDEDGNLGGILWGTYSIGDIADCAQMMAELLEEAQKDMIQGAEQVERDRVKKVPKLQNKNSEKKLMDEFDMRYWKTDWLKEDDEKSEIDNWILGLLDDNDE